MESIQDILELITLEPIEDNIFRGHSEFIVGPRVFGGQVLAQGLYAATQTVPAERIVHSLHGYFILPGDASKPIVYNVDRIRDGGSFTTRRVIAVQSGRPIFNMAASFQVEEEGMDHQISMPDVPPPEDVKSDIELLEAHRDRLPPHLLHRLSRPTAVEFRPVEGDSLVSGAEGDPFLHIWMRVKGQMPNDPALHRATLAYASDYNLLGTAIRPHGATFDKLIAASLDHAMWFHRDFRTDEWLLYALDSPSASGGRGFTRGNLFDRQGRLVASVTQEGLIRPRRPR